MQALHLQSQQTPNGHSNSDTQTKKKNKKTKYRMTTKVFFLLIIIAAVITNPSIAQYKIKFSGQASAYTLYHFEDKTPLWAGGRYIPQLNSKFKATEKTFIDFEASANIYGNMGIRPFDSLSADGNIKPYRLWARYSGEQFEVRLGLQKINFGSASILRPLMWFDQMDPRDPLQITDGVWSLLGRYYFLDNTNVWLWGLYGNKEAKAWEVGSTDQSMPELGGRIQTPVPGGEAAFSYHFRKSDLSGLNPLVPGIDKIPEHRFGIDAKWDVEIGFWAEASLTHKSKDAGPLNNTIMANIGADYTFNVGSGLSVIAEQLFASTSEEIFEFNSGITFSALSLNYPLSIFDNLSAIVYFDWKNKNPYNFITWKRQYNQFSFHLMGFWNPEQFSLPQQENAGLLFSGKGIQFMIVFNH